MVYIWKFPRKFKLENVRGGHHLILVGRMTLHLCENSNEHPCSTKIRLVEQLSMYPFMVDCSV